MNYFLIIAGIPVMKSQLSGGISALNTHIPFKYKPALRRNIATPVGILSLNIPLHIPGIAILVYGEIQKIVSIQQTFRRKKEEQLYQLYDSVPV